MNNQEQLRLISIFHYIVGAMEACFGCMGLMHLFIGISMLISPASWASDGPPPPPFAGWFFAIAGGALILAGLTAGILTALSGRFIAKRRHRNFSIVIAAIICLFMPFGTVLGVFTLVALTKSEVIELYKNPTEQAALETR